MKGVVKVCHIMERKADVIRRKENKKKFSFLCSDDINQISFLKYFVLLFKKRTPCMSVCLSIRLSISTLVSAKMKVFRIFMNFFLGGGVLCGKSCRTSVSFSANRQSGSPTALEGRHWITARALHAYIHLLRLTSISEMSTHFH